MQAVRCEPRTGRMQGTGPPTSTMNVALPISVAPDQPSHMWDFAFERSR
jgi:hypothetical protein